MEIYKTKILWICSLFIVSLMISGCGGCSKSGLKAKKYQENRGYTSSIDKSSYRENKKTSIKMEHDNGVKYIWVEINDIKLRFIFDTGASNICISSSEATVLHRQGTLRKEDILDVQYFQDATGRVSAGTRINLRTVRIGDKLLKNIEAIVIDNNDAPLLFGQSALEKFGKISIDNKKNIIIFEY